MRSLYDSYRKKRYASGGDMGIDPGAILGAASGNPLGMIQALQGLGTGIVDAVDKPDQFSGVQSRMGAFAKGSISGGGIGAIVSLLSNNKARKEGMRDFRSGITEQNRAAASRSGAAIATNPEILNGYQNAGYFEEGGDLRGRKRAKTQAEVDAANALAKRLTSENDMGLIANNAYAARNVGDVLPDFVDPAGRPAMAAPTPKLRTTLPAGISPSDVKTEQGIYWYVDPHTGDTVDVAPSVATKVPRPLSNPMAKLAHGGSMKAPLTGLKAVGGQLRTLSSENTEITGRSHEEGGVHIPKLGAEVEDKETTNGSYVFSDQLGFADVHKKIARAKGLIEKKPATQERVNSMKRLKLRENNMMMQQELLKAQMG